MSNFIHKLSFTLIVVSSIINCHTTSAQIFSKATSENNYQAGILPIKFSDASDSPYEERIETERHDFTQSATTVGKGVFQIEGGYSYFYKDNHEEIEESHTLPEMMFRIGLSEDIEIRFRTNYAWRFIDEEENIEGNEDFRFGIKMQATEKSGWIPESAIELRFAVPTAGKSWSTNRFEVGLDYIYDWQLTEKVTLYGSTAFGTNALGDFSLLPEHPADERFILWSQSIALGIELTESITLYSEFYTLQTHGLNDNLAASYYNIGIDYYFTDNFVVDIRSGAGLSNDADDFFIGIGGGYRF